MSWPYGVWALLGGITVVWWCLLFAHGVSVSGCGCGWAHGCDRVLVWGVGRLAVCWCDVCVLCWCALASAMRSQTQFVCGRPALPANNRHQVRAHAAGMHRCVGSSRSMVAHATAVLIGVWHAGKTWTLG